MVISTYILFIFLTILSFIYGWREKELKAFALCGTLSILVCILTLANHPSENKTTSQILSIEKKLNEINKPQKELIHTTNEIINIIYKLQEKNDLCINELKKDHKIEEKISNRQRNINRKLITKEKILNRKIYK